MAEVLREREVTRPPEQRTLPTIQRESRDLHTPLDSLGRISQNLRIPYEQTRAGEERAIAHADFDMRLARNISDLKLTHSTPLDGRFLRLLESMQG